jgi:hypothetical protein
MALSKDRAELDKIMAGAGSACHPTSRIAEGRRAFDGHRMK